MMVTFQFMNQYDVNVHQIEPQEEQDLQITLVLLPAIGIPIKKYDTLIAGLSRLGFIVISADYPCCGENKPHVDKTIDYNYSDLVNEFIPNLVSLSRAKQTVLLGHSLGAHLATLYATQHPITVIGVATGNIHYKNWNGLGRFNILRAVIVFKTLLRIYGYFPGYKVGFGLKETKGIINDWCHTAMTGNYDYFTQNLPTARGKSYFINIIGDEFSPLKSTSALAACFRDRTIEQIELPESLKGNKHSIWLKEPTIVIKKISEYLINDKTAQ